jgi:hypothetical protein
MNSTTDRAFCTPYWPVAYTAFANGNWRMIAVTVLGNGRIQLGLYDQATQSPAAVKTLSGSATESALVDERLKLMMRIPRSGDELVPEDSWVRCPIRPMVETCQATRTQRLVAQFFWADDTAELHISTFSGDGINPLSSETHRIKSDPTRELVLGDSTRIGRDPKGAENLKSLMINPSPTRAVLCPQITLHNLHRLIPEQACAPAQRVTTRLRGPAPLAF